MRSITRTRPTGGAKVHQARRGLPVHLSSDDGEVMVEPEIEDIYAAEIEQCCTEAPRYVERLRRNMGHPGPAVPRRPLSTGRRPGQLPAVCIGVSA
eukprot:6529113-Pyramimonas_sp.AAC.1